MRTFTSILLVLCVAACGAPRSSGTSGTPPDPVESERDDDATNAPSGAPGAATSSAEAVATRCAEPDPRASANPCDGLDLDSCTATEGCEPRELDPEEPGYPGVLCGWIGIPGEPGFADAEPAAINFVECDPTLPNDPVCRGLVCVPGLNECRDACSSHSDCLWHFYCGDNGVGVTHCIECGAPPN